MRSEARYGMGMVATSSTSGALLYSCIDISRKLASANEHCVNRWTYMLTARQYFYDGRLSYGNAGLCQSKLNLSLLWQSLFRNLPFGHCDRNVKGILRTLDIRQVLARNVKRCAMSRRSNRHRQATLHSHSTFERKQLHSNLALVVVHCDDAVEMRALEKDGIAWIWPLNVDASLPGCRYSGTDLVDLLATKRAIFAVVRIKSAYGQTR